MTVVPSNHHLRSSGLLEHVKHFGLEYVIDGLDGDGGTGLRHSEDIHTLQGVEVRKPSSSSNVRSG